MSFMRGDLLTRVRKLVKGYAMPTLPWLKAMEKLSDFDPPPACIFAWCVLELMEQGIGEEEAGEVADMEYVAEKKVKKKAYKELKAICKLQERGHLRTRTQVLSKRYSVRRRSLSMSASPTQRYCRSSRR